MDQRTRCIHEVGFFHHIRISIFIQLPLIGSANKADIANLSAPAYLINNL